MSEVVLTINSGSSSVKFALFEASASPRPAALMRGEVDGIGHGITQEEAVSTFLSGLDKAYPAARLIGAGHRVVHGGERFIAPIRITAEIRAALERLSPLAPLHQPHNLAGIDALARIHPNLPQIACFDTSFHLGQAWEVTAFALPRELRDEGIRRYGFHGLSYEYIASILCEHLGERADGRVVVAHLGSGASMCAMRERRSMATTMGFTALDGLPMGTRCGALDPGVPLYLLGRGWSAERIADTLWHRSGLSGLSEISDDVRTLVASNDPRAARALEYFAHRIAHELGALQVELGGLDALVFTGGIGEHVPSIRARACELAACLGIKLELHANDGNATRISSPASAVEVLVLPTDEETVVARGTMELLSTAAGHTRPQNFPLPTEPIG